MFKYIYFYLPFFYALKTRYNNLSAVLGWIIEYLVPITFIVLYEKSSLPISVYVVGLLFIYNTYEIGYIENDTETVKQEDKPTLRLSVSARSYYESKKVVIYTSKMVFSILMALFLIYKNVNMWIVLYVFLLVPIYYIYNRNRSKMNNHIFLAQFKSSGFA